MRTMIVRRCILLLLVHFASSFEPCLTPRGKPGECIPLRKCAALQSAHPRLVKRSHCGFTGHQPKVCCQNGVSSPGQVQVASSDLLPDPSECGIYSSRRIIGGEATDLDEFPWMALLRFQLDNGQRSFECGGSLINKRYVVTAAHCLLPQLVGVRLGEHNTETDPDCITNKFGRDCAPPAIDYGIEEMITYKSYEIEGSSPYHDIGLIRLDRDVKYSDFIRPICLPLTADDIYKSYVGQHLVVSGWGITDKGVKSSIKLKVQVPVRETSECESNYGKLNVTLSLDAGQICAGGVRGKDSCRADSGGPLMAIKKDAHREPQLYCVGVVSFGPNPCGQENLPAVYTKVSKYVRWIVDNLKP